MRRRMLKSKVHRAVVTATDADEGSVSIDSRLMGLADIRQWEQVAVPVGGRP